MLYIPPVVTSSIGSASSSLSGGIGKLLYKKGLRNEVSTANILEINPGFRGNCVDGTDCPVTTAEYLDNSVKGVAKGVTLERRLGVAKGATSPRHCNRSSSSLVSSLSEVSKLAGKDGISPMMPFLKVGILARCARRR